MADIRMKSRRTKRVNRAVLPKNRRSSSLTTFPEMKGRTVELIEVCLSSDYHCVSIRFQDKTDFTVEIDTRLVCQAMHSDWKTEDMRVLKRWPVIEE
jgi:hypothetical protein